VHFGKKCHYARDCPEPSKILFSTYSPELYACSYALVANYFPNWTVDMGASKHIIRDRTALVNFHHYKMGSLIVMLGNSREVDILGVVTYKLSYEEKRRFSSMLSTHLGCEFAFCF